MHARSVFLSSSAALAAMLAISTLNYQQALAESGSKEDAEIEALGTDAAVSAEALSAVKDSVSHSAHEHGIGRLDVAVEGAHVALELTLPANDVVGFEHRPKSQDDKAKAAKAKQLLEDPAKLFGFSEAAGCAVAVEDVSTSIEEGEEDSDEASQEGGEHAEYLASYSVKCKDVSKLNSISVKLFNSFSSLTSIKVQSATSKGQSASVLTKERAVIEGL